MSRPRVLLIAESCNPEMVSVPLEGWSHARAIAKLTDAHVVTQIRNRDAVLRAGWVEGREFTSIDSEPVYRRAYQLAGLLRGGAGRGWTVIGAFDSLAYPYFEHLAWRQFGRRIQRHEFDIVHRLVPISPVSSSPMAGWCRRAGVPFVMGPLNGGVRWPRAFDSARRKENEYLSYVRDAHKLLPGYQSTRQNASALIMGSRDTWEQMPRMFRRKCIYVPENGIEPERFQARRQRRARLPLRVIFVGRLVPYKGADMLMEAAAPFLRQLKVELQIVGDGPQMPELRELARREGIENQVCFTGWLNHESVQRRLVDSDLLGFPSIREFGGAAVLEAMASGVAPAVVNYGGPGELVTDATGFLVPMGSRAQIIERFGAILAQVIDDPSILDAKADAAFRRAHGQFTWDAKARQVLDIYRWVLDPRRPKPAFEMPLADLA